jgi:ABC-type Na+ efflux pump permease subunit
VLDAGNVIVVLSVPARVNELLAVKVLPSAIVRVADVAGAVIATLLTLVAVATPIVGVTKVGEVAKTKEPDPVSSVTAAAKLADDGVPNQVATPDPRDVRPVPP